MQYFSLIVKKFIAIILCICILFSVSTVTFADDDFGGSGFGSTSYSTVSFFDYIQDFLNRSAELGDDLIEDVSSWWSDITDSKYYASSVSDTFGGGYSISNTYLFTLFPSFGKASLVIGQNGNYVYSLSTTSGSGNGFFNVCGYNTDYTTGIAITLYSSEFTLPSGSYTLYFKPTNWWYSFSSSNMLYYLQGYSSSGWEYVSYSRYSSTYESSYSSYYSVSFYASDTYSKYRFYSPFGSYRAGSSSTFYSVNSSLSYYIRCYALDDSPSDASSTRMSSFASAINTYNTTNNYTDDSEVVNYYISPILIDSGLDVNLDVSFGSLLDLDIYDEDALIFTEPVTETQYQTTGWTYDYTTRTYTLDLDSGTFYIGDYNIDTIDLTYGDDELTITYYSDNTAIATDEYAYLMVSQSECSLNGHTYVLDEDGSVAAGCGTTGYYLYTCSVCGAQTTETIDATGEHSYEYSIYQDPTCTAEGTGLYSCSVCGNQYTEPIAATGHSYEYSIYQEPTCTATGIGIYTCSECGDQYTETIDPTGHTAEIVEYVATEYDENGTAIVYYQLALRRFCNVGYNDYIL